MAFRIRTLPHRFRLGFTFPIAALALVLSASVDAATYRFSAERRASVEARSVGRAENRWQIELAVPVLEVNPAEDGFHRLVAPGLVPTVDVGRPELATSGKLFAVPPGHRLRWRLVGAERRVLENVVPRPAQREFRCGGGPRSFSFDRTAYVGTEFVPASPVSVERIGSLRGVDLVRVAFHPLRAMPEARRLEVATRMIVDVWLEQVERSAAPVLSRPFVELLGRFTVNGVATAAREQEAMLIIAADGLREALGPFVAWKRETGVKVDVVSASVVGSTQEKIREYVQRYWASAVPRPTYLLLAGDRTSVPPNFEATGAGSAASDWRYALLEGGDSDIVPDLFYGRLLADTPEEASRVVARWIAYERDSEASDHYVRGTTIASNEGYNPSDEDYANQIGEAMKSGADFLSVDQFFQRTMTATPANISGAIDEGRSWIAYFGHGSGTSWGSTNGTFNVANVERLANGSRLPVLIDVACMNGAWTRIAKCFGRAWSNHASGGAVGYYGGSVNISWHPPAVMSVGIAQAHFQRKVATLGASTLAGQIYLLEQMGTGSHTVDNLKWFNLFGDPSLLLRTRRPLLARVTHSVARVADGAVLAVGAAAENGQAVADLRVVATDRAGEILAQATTDANGTAYLRLPRRYRGLVVTVTGKDVQPSQWRL
jgi:hypothetical protein